MRAHRSDILALRTSRSQRSPKKNDSKGAGFPPDLCHSARGLPVRAWTSSARTTLWTFPAGIFSAETGSTAASRRCRAAGPRSAAKSDKVLRTSSFLSGSSARPSQRARM
ncbi:MAG: hypothetical protein A2902_02345 [Elusimicrobia bacterium RIFCSPLOWO2_01_FULL_64_13]|nr:MAG: hypothetical protein A2902_02345 [Elusimicrobia bacterium RIFCSPLOWO2_01_FULL_64_13]